MSWWRAAVPLLAAVLLCLGSGQALQVQWQVTLDQAMQWNEQEKKWTDQSVASRDGYYYQIRGPAVATDGDVVLVAWEEWSEGGTTVGRIGLKAVDTGGQVVGEATVNPDENCVMFGPALASYGRGEFLLAVAEVPSDKLQTQDYGTLKVYKVTVANGQVTCNPVNVTASNGAYPYLVHLGRDASGNEYVALLYESWSPDSGAGDVVLQVLKIDTSGNVTALWSTPLTVAKGVCKDYVKDNVHYFGHARPVASVYRDGGSEYLIVALTDYSSATPNISSWGFFGEWRGCKVRAFVIQLPGDLSELERSQPSVIEVQGSLTLINDTNELPWVADNVIVYRAGPLWGSMSASDTTPDIYAAVIENEGGQWVFKCDRPVYRRIYTQTAPCVVHVYNDTSGGRYYLVVFSDNSGGFGKERIAGVLLRYKSGRLQVLAQYDLTGYGNGVYFYCPTAAAVATEYGNAEVAVTFYKGDSGYGGHKIGDVVVDLAVIGEPVEEMASWVEQLVSELERTRVDLQQGLKNVQRDLKSTKKELDSVKQDVDKVKQDLQGVRSKVSDLEKKVKDVESRISGVESEIQGVKSEVKSVKEEVSGVKGKVERLEGRVSKLERRKIPVAGAVALLSLIAALAARRRH